jgi:hypothetical protein
MMKFVAFHVNTHAKQLWTCLGMLLSTTQSDLEVYVRCSLLDLGPSWMLVTCHEMQLVKRV